MALLFNPLPAAELDAREAFCLGTIQAGTFKVVGAVLDMGAKFLLHVSIYL